jgi:hypothetical protein
MFKAFHFIFQMGNYISSTEKHSNIELIEQNKQLKLLCTQLEQVITDREAFDKEIFDKEICGEDFLLYYLPRLIALNNKEKELMNQTKVIRNSLCF